MAREVYPVLSKDGAIMHIEDFPFKIGITTRAFGSITNNHSSAEKNKQFKKIKNRTKVDRVILMKPEEKSKIIALSLPLEDDNVYKCDGFICGLEQHNRKILIGMPLRDCPGIWFYSETIAGINHSGWKGILDGITQKTIIATQFFKVTPQDLKVLIWPGICKDCYPVGPEFEDYFPGHVDNGHINLSRVVENEFIDAGLLPQNISILQNLCTRCTYNDNDPLLFSHRRGDKKGVLAYFII